MVTRPDRDALPPADPNAALVQLRDRLLVMRGELVDRLAGKLDGGQLALLASIDAAACAVEAELEARRGEEGGE